MLEAGRTRLKLDVTEKSGPDSLANKVTGLIDIARMAFYGAIIIKDVNSQHREQREKPLGYPTKQQWKRVFQTIPLWAVVLLIVLLYGRLVVVALFHWIID